MKICRLLQNLRKKLSESFLLTRWNAIRNDNTASQKMFFFFPGTTLSRKIRNFKNNQNALSLPH